MSLKTIAKKQCGNNLYTIKYWSDPVYVVYRDDRTLRSVHRIPEIAHFYNEDDARKFLKDLNA